MIKRVYDSLLNNLQHSRRMPMLRGFLLDLRYTLEMLEHRGFQVVPISLSEFQKGNGGVTCLSLRIG